MAVRACTRGRAAELGVLTLSCGRHVYYQFEINKISEIQYELIHGYLPVQNRNVWISNLTIINAVFHLAGSGHKWRALPPRFENWHTIYTRLRRWAEAGVLERLLAALQEHRLIRIRVDCLDLGSSSVKGHPDSTGAPQKGTASNQQILRRMPSATSLPVFYKSGSRSAESSLSEHLRRHRWYVADRRLRVGHRG